MPLQDPKQLFGKFYYRSTVVAVATTATQLVSAEPRRFLLSCMGSGSNPFYVYIDNTVSSTNGWTLPQFNGQGIKEFYYYQYGGMLGGTWWAINSGFSGSQNMQVIEGLIME